MRRIHVVGAGLAGLAAALDLAEAGTSEIHLHEATARAGGRCWSFHDARLDRLIDNGNHLVLSGNPEVLEHCRRIGTRHLLDIAEEAALRFHDLGDGSDWTLRIPAGLGDLARGRVSLPPGIGAGLALDLLRLLAAGRRATVGETVRHGPAMDRLWGPLGLAVLNEPPETGAAAPLGAVLRRTVLKGGGACRPVLMPHGLGPTLIAPALQRIEELGARPHWRTPLRAIDRTAGRAGGLVFDDRTVPLRGGDAVLLAVPAPVAGRLLGVPAPAEGRPILNAHFRVPPDAVAGAPRLLGLIGGFAQWIFVRGDVVSMTVSAADACGDGPDAESRLWSDVSRALGIDGPPLAARLLRETVATFAATPASLARRLPMRTAMANVLLAGDYVAAPLPATLEGAILSGRAAAEALLNS